VPKAGHFSQIQPDSFVCLSGFAQLIRGNQDYVFATVVYLD
jgi:hypothetical protein